MRPPTPPKKLFRIKNIKVEEKTEHYAEFKYEEQTPDNFLNVLTKLGTKIKLLMLLFIDGFLVAYHF